MTDSGSSRAVTVLKYVILTQLLAQSETDYMTQKEANVYASNEEIIAMLDLKEGFLKNDIKKIIAVTTNKKVNLLADPIINQYSKTLLRSARLKALIYLCQPYKAVRLEYLSR